MHKDIVFKVKIKSKFTFLMHVLRFIVNLFIVIIQNVVSCSCADVTLICGVFGNVYQ